MEKKKLKNNVKIVSVTVYANVQAATTAFHRYSFKKRVAKTYGPNCALC